MSRRLEGPRTVGSLRVGAIAETCIRPLRVAGTVAVAGWKRPLAVLFASGGEVTAFDLHGAPLDPEAVEALCPGACAAMLRD